MAGKKTSCNATHGAPSLSDDPNKDAPPISKADVANKRTKLTLELLKERKKIEVLNKDIIKRLKEHATSVTKFLSVITCHDETFLTKEVHLAKQTALVERYKVRLLSKDETFKAQKKAFVFKACCSHCCSSSSVGVEEERGSYQKFQGTQCLM
jgi:hypothetical protein